MIDHFIPSFVFQDVRIRSSAGKPQLEAELTLPSFPPFFTLLLPSPSSTYRPRRHTEPYYPLSSAVSRHSRSPRTFARTANSTGTLLPPPLRPLSSDLASRPAVLVSRMLR